MCRTANTALQNPQLNWGHDRRGLENSRSSFCQKMNPIVSESEQPVMHHLLIGFNDVVLVTLLSVSIFLPCKEMIIKAIFIIISHQILIRFLHLIVNN